MLAQDQVVVLRPFKTILEVLVLVLNSGLGQDQDQDHHSRPWLDHAILVLW